MTWTLCIFQLLAFSSVIAIGCCAAGSTVGDARQQAAILNPADFRHYVDFLNGNDPEDVNGFIANAGAFEWMKRNIPFFSCPDGDVELTYYYRWWAYRKHIKKTAAGFVITEFLRPVKHATDYNAISCALGLQIAEGRWLQDPRYLNDYIAFWLRSGENGGLHRALHQFSGWTATALFDRWLADGKSEYLLSQFDVLRADYEAWEKERLTENGLFWQRDVSDGKEIAHSSTLTHTIGRM